HNGSWRAEPADRYDNRYVLLAGPTDREHQWSRSRALGEAFGSVTAMVAVTADRDTALAALPRTAARSGARIATTRNCRSSSTTS
ncbi:hypothetical protein AB4212_44240, partial [Streptomyces sp. 2MCAF27]